jgi:hypothetical protein
VTRHFLALMFLAQAAAGCVVDEGVEVGPQCDDGADNDADALYDCDDPDCMSEPVCSESGDDDDSSLTDDDDSAGDDDDSSPADDDDSAGDDDDSAGDDDDSAGDDDDSAGDDDDSAGDDDDSASSSTYVGALTLATGAAADWFCQSWDRVDGDLSITFQQETTLASLSCLREVTGELRISSLSLESVSLPALTALLGPLVVRQNEQLLSLSLPVLSMSGGLELSSNPLLADVSGLAGLQHIAGSLEMFSNAQLLEMALDALSVVQGDVDIRSNQSLQRVRLDGLATVGGELSVLFHQSLVELRLPSLTAVTENLRVSSNELLEEVSIPVLSSVGGVFYVGTNMALATLQLPQMSSVGSLRISSNVSLPMVEFGSLTLVTGDLHIAVNNSLPHIDMPWLTTVQGDFYVGSNASLASFGFPALQTVSGEFRVTHNQSLSTSIIQNVIDGLGSGIGGAVVLEGNAPG